ncbi:MAG TPA: hypothetical protein VN867_06045 [Candidatus Binataceae bacterium]|nr:hypothetical protein [Candidatus Binataceae bacterium]
MKSSSLYMEHMRRRASTHLPNNFARLVIEDSKHGWAEGIVNQLRLVAVTGILCVATTVSVHWMQMQRAQQASLQAWAATAAKIQVLEETI